MPVDNLVDGFTDNNVEDLSSEDENDNGNEDISTDIGAAAMTVEQLEEMRTRVLAMFAESEKELAKIAKIYRDPKSEKPTKRHATRSWEPWARLASR